MRAVSERWDFERSQREETRARDVDRAVVVLSGLRV